MTDEMTPFEDHEDLQSLDRQLSQEATAFHAPPELSDRIFQTTLHHLPSPAPLSLSQASGGQEAGWWRGQKAQWAAAAAVVVAALAGIWALRPSPQPHPMEPSRIVTAGLEAPSQAQLLSPAVERLLVESDPAHGGRIAAMLDARDATWCGITGELHLLANGMQERDVHQLNVDLY